eukprot:180927_1
MNIVSAFTNIDKQGDQKNDNKPAKSSQKESIIHTGWTRSYFESDYINLWLELNLMSCELSTYKHHRNSYLWNEFISRTNIHTAVKDDNQKIDEKTAELLVLNLFDINDINMINKNVTNILINVFINKTLNDLQSFLITKEE